LISSTSIKTSAAAASPSALAIAISTEKNVDPIPNYADHLDECCLSVAIAPRLHHCERKTEVEIEVFFESLVLIDLLGEPRHIEANLPRPVAFG